MIPLRWAVLINWSSEYSGRCYCIILQLLDIFKDGLIGMMLAIKLFTDFGIWVLGSVFLWEKMDFSYRRVILAWTVLNSFVHWSEQKKTPGLFQRGLTLQILQLIPSWIAWELAGIWTRYPGVDLLTSVVPASKADDWAAVVSLLKLQLLPVWACSFRGCQNCLPHGKTWKCYPEGTSDTVCVKLLLLQQQLLCSLRSCCVPLLTRLIW